MATVRELITKLGFKLDKGSLDRANKGAENVKKGMEGAGQAGDRAGDKISSGAKRGADALNSEAEAARRAGREIDSLGEKAKKIGDKGSSLMMGGATVAAAGAGLMAPFAMAANEGMDFEQTMARVRAISLNKVKREQGAEEELKQFKMLEAEAKRLGATTEYTNNEVAQSMMYLGMAGWDTQQMISGLPALLDLTTVAGTDLASVADILSDDLSAFGLDLKKDTKAADHLADVYATTITRTNTDIQKLHETMKYAAPIATAYGASLEETATLTGLMAQAGIKDTMAGTALRAGFTRLAAPMKRGQKMMDALGISFEEAQEAAMEAKEGLSKWGIELEDENKQPRKMTVVLRELREATKDLGREEKLQAYASIFGQEAMTGWMNILNADEKLFDDLVKAMETAAGTAKQMADDMRNTTGTKFKLLSSAISGLLDVIYDHIKPALQGFADAASRAVGAVIEWANANPKLAAGLSKAVAALGVVLSVVGSVVVAVGGLMSLWGVIGPALTAGWAAVSASIAPIIAMIVGVIGVMKSMYENWDEIFSYMEPGLGRLQAGIDALTAAWSEMSPIVMPLLEGIASLLGGAIIRNLKFMFSVATFVFNEMAYLVKLVADALAGIANNIEFVMGVFGKAKASADLTGSANNMVVNIQNQVDVNSPEEAAAYTDRSGSDLAIEAWD